MMRLYGSVFTPEQIIDRTVIELREDHPQVTLDNLVNMLGTILKAFPEDRAMRYMVEELVKIIGDRREFILALRDPCRIVDLARENDLDYERIVMFLEKKGVPVRF